MLENETQAIDYWNKRVKDHGFNVGWGSQPGSSWYITKQKYINEILYKGEINQIFDICCGNAFSIMEVKNPFNTVKYLGVDGSQNNIDYNREHYGKLENTQFECVSLSNLLPMMNSMRQSNPSYFQQTMVIIYDALFHIVEDTLYMSTLQSIVDCKPLYFGLTIAEAPEKTISEEEGHFIQRPFNRNITGYVLIKEEASEQLASQKLLIYRRV